jgi:hypothetical protein
VKTKPCKNCGSTKYYAKEGGYVKGKLKERCTDCDKNYTGGNLAYSSSSKKIPGYNAPGFNIGLDKYIKNKRDWVNTAKEIGARPL